MFDAAYKRLQNKQQAEDIVQDVLYRLWSKREKLHIENLGGYFNNAIRYEVINYLSRNKITAHLYEPLYELAAETDTPEIQLIAKQLMEKIDSYAQSLPDKRREIFLLHYRSRLSTREIAERLNISQKTVQNQLWVAVEGLKGQIAPLVIILLNIR